jgi:RNA polymerase sigma-70 factor, ECF subfamily
MPPTGTPGDFDPPVRRMIAAKARKLVGHFGLRPHERPDVEQDLAARLVPRLKDYDPARSTLEAFAAIVIEQAAANLIRDRMAAKRTPPRQPGPPTPVEEAPDARTEEDRSRLELVMDVADILARLPTDKRALAYGLMGGTVSQVARATGVPRTTVYGAVADLREIFERAGLRDYV